MIYKWAVLVLILFSTPALAIEFPNTWSYKEYNVTSANDPLFIEMGDAVYEYMPTTIKLHINDEFMRANANYVEISVLSGLYDSIGNNYGSGYNSYLPYNGEEIVEFGVRPGGKTDSTSEVRFSLIYTTTTDESSPDTSWGSDLPYFDCYHKDYPPDSDTFCNGGKCTMCQRTLGIVRKSFLLLPSDSSAPTPGGFSFTDVKAEDSYYDGQTFPGYLEYSYANDDDPLCMERYTFRLDATPSGSTVNQMKYWPSALYDDYSEISAPGGATQGLAFELFSDTTYGPFDDNHYKLNIDYVLVADFSPAGSGSLTVKAHRQGCSQSSGSSVSPQVVSAAKAFATGYTVTPGAPSGYKPMPGAIKIQDFTPTHLAWLSKDPVEAPEPAPELGATFTGKVTDGQGHPLAYSEMHLNYNGLWYKDFASGLDGRYSIEIPTFNPEEESRISIATFLNYKRDGKNYFLIADEWHDNKIPYFMKTFDYKAPENLANDISWGEPTGSGWYYVSARDYSSATKNNIEWKTNSGDFFATKKFALIYYHFHNTVDFYIGSLGATLDYKLPVEVFVRGNKWSRYTTSDSQILIFKEHVNEDHPKRGFLEAHEFSHHVMYDLYGRWPEGDDMLEMENHAGYINPSTADSYIEGFAEFMPMVLRDYTGEANPHIYSDFGSLEVNYRTSSRRGRLEEFAVAGVLWDLYDKNDDRGDTISMTLPDIWSIISIKRKDFYEYYKAFVDTFPEKKAQIDAVFIEHGFFEDKNPGNGKWDYVEPFKDANNNGVYDAGEAFVDYGSASGLPAAMFYDTGETIGKATDYTRLPRSLEVYYPGAYLKVSETDALLYTVSVDLADPQDGQDYSYTTGQAEGLIYIMPLPDHIEATITVAPKEYSAQSTYTIINSEYSEKLYASDKGYFDEHTFGLSGSGMILEDGEEWGFDFDGGYTGTEVLQVGSSEIDVSPIEEDQATQQAAGGEFPWLIIIVILLIAGAAFIFMKRRPVGIPVSTPQTVAPTHSGPSKFCHICGRRIEPGQKYCRECGSSSQ